MREVSSEKPIYRRAGTKFHFWTEVVVTLLAEGAEPARDARFYSYPVT